MKSIAKYTFALMVLVLILIWAEIARGPENNKVGLYYFDVGQGDAELIQKGNYQILIDGGPDDKVLTRLGEVMPLSDRVIEAIVLTHPHADHLVGLNQVLERYKVEKVYITGMVHTSNQYIEFLDKLKKENITTLIPELGERFEPFENSSITFLWPGKNFYGKSSCDNAEADKDQKASGENEDCIENVNNTSEVARFCYFDQCALYLGDLQNDAQSELLASVKHEEIASNIIKVAHHGSSNGTNELALKSIIPHYAVISVGADNRYGHPHAATLDFLHNFKISANRGSGQTDDSALTSGPATALQILRTDQRGTIKFYLTPTDIILPH